MPEETAGDPKQEPSDTESPQDGRTGDERPAAPEKKAPPALEELPEESRVRKARLPGIRHATPTTVVLVGISVLCAIALIIVFSLESVRVYLEGKGLLWILPVGMALVFGVLIVIVVVREMSNLQYVEGLLEDMVEANKRLRLLLEAGRDIGSTLELQLILETVIDYTAAATGSSIGAVYLWEKSEDVLRLAVSRGVDENKMMFKELPMKQGLLGRVAGDRQMVAIDDTSTIDERDNVFFGAADPLSMVLVPLVARGRLIGMLVAASEEPHAYAMDEKRLLDGLGELASLSITNAELYRIARRSLDALSRERGVKDSVLEEMVAGVITADSKGRIAVFNREAQRLTGYTFAEMTQARLRPEASLDQNPLGPLEHGLLEVLDNPSLVREGDALLLKSDKALLPVSYRIYPLVSGPEVIGAACVFMEARMAEGSRKEPVDYQVLLRSLGARIERVYTHPLSRVIERMRSMDIDDWSRAREDIIKTLRAGHSTLLGLLEDLEQYLNCTTTREWDTPGECDLAAMTQEVVREAVGAASAEGVTVSVKMAGLKPAFGYERMVRSALEQVIQNACIAAFEGDKRVTVIGRNESSRVVVEVADTGPGFSSEASEFMFMPFYTAWEGRSGLGLSLVKRVMSRLGGKVSAKDSPQGATFTLEFPTSPGLELDAGDESAAGAVGG
jgi:signal transduction histidine kinase/putative methionine-R-sulfoxide reductase with GAF domain